MNFSWDHFHSDCSQVSSASIICEDGVIFTHKLILASMSRLMEDILRDIPAADEVTLYLTSYSKLKVTEFLSDVLQKNECSEQELGLIFDSVNHTHPIKTEKCNEIEFRKKEDEQQVENSLDSDVVLGEMDESVKCEKELLEKFDSETEENIRIFEKELIQNPTTKRDIFSNQKTDKKIRYAKAIALYKSGKVTSYRRAAKICGVTDVCLRKYVLSGKFYKGAGQCTKRFTKEEEKRIIDKALNQSSSEGKDLTYKLLIDIALEEAEVIKINHPERSDHLEFGRKGRKGRQQIYTYVSNLASRNNIRHLVNSNIKKDRDQRRNYECEICYQTFTYKNCLTGHKKTCHSFLFC